MPIKKLKEFLDRNQIDYLTISHSRAITTQEIDASAHIPGKEFAETVMVKLQDVELATEAEFRQKFPTCEVGAMPPFGNLYGLDVYVAEKLVEDDVIAFNAGTHTELIQMDYADFHRLVKPNIFQMAKKSYA